MRGFFSSVEESDHNLNFIWSADENQEQQHLILAAVLQFQQMSTFAIAQFNKRRPAQLHYKHDIDFTNFCDQIQSESFSKCCP